MSLLVNNNIELVGKPNLLTNGQFIVNQRNIGVNTWTKAFGPGIQGTYGTYVADCWRIDACNVAYLEFQQSAQPSGNYYLRFRGKAQAGQMLRLINIDRNILGVTHDPQFSSSGDISLTAAVTVQNNTNSVPIYAMVYPPRHNSMRQIIYSNFESFNNLYSFNNSIKSHAAKEIVCCMVTSSVFQNYYTIEIIFLETGSFDFNLYNARLFSGLYKNPPLAQGVSHAEELERCMRYYQVLSNLRICVRACYPRSNPATSIFHTTIPFPVRMAGTPTMSLATHQFTVSNGNDGWDAWSTEYASVTPRQDSFIASVMSAGNSYLEINAATYGFWWVFSCTAFVH